MEFRYNTSNEVQKIFFSSSFMRKGRLRSISPSMPSFYGVHSRKSNSRNFWPGTKNQSFFDSIEQQQESWRRIFSIYWFFATWWTFEKKSLKFLEKNLHKIVYKKNYAIFKKNCRCVAGESNFEYTFKFSSFRWNLMVSAFRVRVLSINFAFVLFEK